MKFGIRESSELLQSDETYEKTKTLQNIFGGDKKVNYFGECFNKILKL